MYNSFFQLVRDWYSSTEDFLPLHEPRFSQLDREYVLDAINSTFVSSVGEYVNQFESDLAKYVGSQYAIVTLSGTSALQVALQLAGVKRNDEVITQALTFIATANAISYNGAFPIFLDVDRTTLGLSPDSLHQFLEKKARKKNGSTFNIRTGRQITAIVPMHTFGHPVRMKELLELGDYWNIPIVEDAAESIGSYYTGKACGTLGKLGIFSFNGNKTITCGGGGVIVTNEADLAKLAKHITTTAKIPHQWDFVHDMIGYNFRMPNLNAALACSQLKQIDLFLISKRNLAQYYAEFFSHVDWADFITEPVNTRSNYWLNAILLRNREQRDQFLRDSNNSGIMTRPCWKLLIDLEMYKNCEADTLENSRWIIDRLVNIPSSALPCFVQ